MSYALQALNGGGGPAVVQCLGPTPSLSRSCQCQWCSEGLSWLLQRLPLVWTGQLVLKNDVAAVKMHYVSGNQDLVRASLPPEALTQDGSSTTLSQLRISQRMRLDPSHLDQVSERMQVTLSSPSTTFISRVCLTGPLVCVGC